MKIAFFSDTYYPQLNGVTVSVANFAKELRQKGHTVYIFAPKFKNYKEKDPFVYRLPSIKILNAEPTVHAPIGISPKGLFQLFKMDFDIVHAHGNGFFSLLGYEVARAQGIPFVMTFHTLHNEYTHYLFKGKIVKPRLVERALRFIANRCDGVIAPSPKMKQKLVEFGCKKDIVIIPNFVQRDEFSDVDKGYLHKRLHLPKSIPVILSVGRIGIEKNFHFLIEVFALFSKKDKNSHLCIVGQGPQKENLKKLAQRLNISDRVHFTGRINANVMPKVYADSTIFIFPSITETQGMCVLEAASSGLPIIVSDDGAYEKMVVDGKNGFALPLKVSLFVDKIQKILQNPQLQDKFGNMSKNLVKENFNSEDITENLINYYDEKISKKKLKAKILYRVNRAASLGFKNVKSGLHLLKQQI